MLHVLFYSHSGGSFQRLIDTTGGAQQDRFVGGSALLAERLAAKLGDIVRLESPVSRIEVSGEKVDGDHHGWPDRRPPDHRDDCRRC